jgi:uncharacterized repeat protein (TIGR01451 family)
MQAPAEHTVQAQGQAQGFGSPVVRILTPTDILVHYAGNAEGPPVTVTVEAGPEPLGDYPKIVGVTIGGAAAGDFVKKTDNCSGQIFQTDGRCTVTVAFRPTDLDDLEVRAWLVVSYQRTSNGTFPPGGGPVEQQIAEIIGRRLHMCESATPPQTDEDGDSLYDCWETHGIGRVETGRFVVDLDLKSLGARVDWKDLFVEVDYMTRAAAGTDPMHTHDPRVQPDGSAYPAGVLPPIARVVAAFAKAPVNNPTAAENPAAPDGRGTCSNSRDDDGDGLVDVNDPDCRGISLHVTLGSTNDPPGGRVMDEIPEATPILAWFPPNPNLPHVATFDDLKARFFGTDAYGPPGRRDARRLAARSQAFRYAIFGHSHSVANGNSSGDYGPRSNPPGTPSTAIPRDFLVSLSVGQTAPVAGGPGPRPWDAAIREAATLWNTLFPEEWADFTAATFMHELGHTLGLGHGGGDWVNFKPNYLSIMSYGRQMNLAGAPTHGVDRKNCAVRPDGSLVCRLGRELDYSTQALDDLNEVALKEGDGVCVPFVGGRFCPAWRVLFGGAGGRMAVGRTNLPIDWNEDGDFNDTVRLDASWADRREPASPDERLTGYADWANLRYGLRAAAGVRMTSISPAGTADSTAAPGESAESAGLTSDQYLDGVLGGPDFDADGVGNAQDNCPLVANTPQSDANADGIGDVCQAGSPVADVSVTASPPSAAIRVGSTWIYTLTVHNDGPWPAAAVRLTDSMSAGARVLAVSSPAACSLAPSMACDLGTIANGATMTLVVTAVALAAGTWTHTAGVGASVIDPDAADNEVERDLVILPAPPAPRLASVSLRPTGPTACSTLIATLVLTDPAPAGGARVAIASSNPVALVPSTVLIP